MGSFSWFPPVIWYGFSITIFMLNSDLHPVLKSPYRRPAAFYLRTLWGSRFPKLFQRECFGGHPTTPPLYLLMFHNSITMVRLLASVYPLFPLTFSTASTVARLTNLLDVNILFLIHSHFCHRDLGLDCLVRGSLPSLRLILFSCEQIFHPSAFPLLIIESRLLPAFPYKSV